jgi:hypothetical protein
MMRTVVMVTTEVDAMPVSIVLCRFEEGADDCCGSCGRSLKWN